LEKKGPGKWLLPGGGEREVKPKYQNQRRQKRTDDVGKKKNKKKRRPLHKGVRDTWPMVQKELHTGVQKKELING